MTDGSPTVWREVQDAILRHWEARWRDRTPGRYANEKFDPPEAPWFDLSIQRRPGGPGTIGRRGNRKMDRVGSVFVLIHTPLGQGMGEASDLGDIAAKVFEGCRLPVHDLRFNTAEPLGDAAEIEGGRWWAVTIEARFDYEELR